MVTYQTLSNKYDGSGSGVETFDVYMYPNTSTEDNDCEGYLLNTLENLGNQIMPDLIYEWNFKISYEHPNFDTSNFDNIWDTWTAYTNGRANYDGAHVLVYDKPSGSTKGWSENPTTEGSWDYPYDSMIGLDSADTAPKQNVMLEEVLHNFIDQSHDKVTPMYKDEEHDLGTVYSGAFGDGPVTPMATGYADTHGRHGECQTDAPWNLSYDENITSCTYDALYYTSDNY